MSGNKRTLLIALLVLPMLISLAGCSLKKFALNQVADALTAPGGGDAFTTDNDPELVAAALPFAIKMYESLLNSLPGHAGLALQTGSLYIMYANAFIDNPASMLEDERYREKEFAFGRAKNLYLRGRDMILAALEKRYPGFRAALAARDYRRALGRVKPADAEMLYWSGAGWLGAFAIDPFDMDLGLTIPAAAAIMESVRELDPGFKQGAIDEFFTLYYGALPAYMGGDAQKARLHFQRALELNPDSTSARLALATTVLVSEQDAAAFQELLREVLAVDLDLKPENRLVNVLNQRKARWLLENLENYFLDDESAIPDED